MGLIGIAKYINRSGRGRLTALHTLQHHLVYLPVVVGDLHGHRGAEWLFGAGHSVAHSEHRVKPG